MVDSELEILLLKTTVFEELETETIMLKDSDLMVTQTNRQKMELSGKVIHWDRRNSNLVEAIYYTGLGSDHDIGQRLVKEKPNPNEF